MKYVLTTIILFFLFGLMAIGYILKRKTLRRGCSLNPDDCACLKEGKDPTKCDQS